MSPKVWSVVAKLRKASTDYTGSDSVWIDRCRAPYKAAEVGRL